MITAITIMHTPISAVTTTTATAKLAVAFTTPQNYATRLSNLLTVKSLNPLWCPTIITEPTPQTLTSLSHHLSPHSLSLLSAIAFPSRAAIFAFSTVVQSLAAPLLPPHSDDFIIAAIGKDAQLIDNAFLLNLCSDVNRIRVIVPLVSTPSGLVHSLGAGHGRRVLCPVPKVIGLEEPPVVPDFLRELEAAGWKPIRVDAYETRWLGPTCAEVIVKKGEEREGLEAIVFTSSAEVEGLLKSLKKFGWDWEMVRRKWPRLVVAAHGPVTALGAERLGVNVDLVSGRFDSFQGVVDAVHERLTSLGTKCM